jgi:hypothetical protein
VGVDVPISRLWADVTVKWRPYQPDGHDDQQGGGIPKAAARHAFADARSALLAGRLDEARTGFAIAAGAPGCALAHVGIGDVAAAKGDWHAAGLAFRRARAISGDHPLITIGLAQTMVAAGDPWSAVADLDRLDRSLSLDHDCHTLRQVVRYYLAAALLAAADNARSQLEGEPPVITSRRQLDVCAHIAHRVLELDAGCAELTEQARRLLDQVAEGSGWTWDRRPAALYGALTVIIGLGTVISGGVLGSVAMVLAGVAIGPTLIFWTVLGYRRESWRRTAEAVAPRVWRRGIPD